MTSSSATSSAASSPAVSAAPPTDVYAGFKSALTVAMTLNVFVGLMELLFPSTVVHLLGLPPALSIEWVSYAGLFLIILTGTYVPLRLFPEANLYMAHYVIGLRFVFVLFFLWAGGGFLWFALFDAIFGIWLAATYWRGFQAEIMANP